MTTHFVEWCIAERRFRSSSNVHRGAHPWRVRIKIKRSRGMWSGRRSALRSNGTTMSPAVQACDSRMGEALRDGVDQRVSVQVLNAKQLEEYGHMSVHCLSIHRARRS